MHPWCIQPEDGDEQAWEKSYEDYRAKPSAKLEKLLEILEHHLERDGAPGMSGTAEEQEEEGSESPEEQRPQAERQQQQLEQEHLLLPDKMVIRSYFASSFWLIKLVSDCF